MNFIRQICGSCIPLSNAEPLPYCLPSPKRETMKSNSSTYLDRFLIRGVCFGIFVSPGKSPQTPIYLLTLASTPIRTERMLFFLSLLDISVIVCIMNTPDDLVFSEYARLGGTLSKGELGCTASHCWILQHALRAKHESFIVLEDDCDLHKNFNRFHEWLSITKNQDCVLFGGSDWHLEKRKLEGGFYVANKDKGRVCGSFAYWLSAGGAKKLSEEMKKPPLLPADHYFHNIWPFLAVLFPPLAVADRTTSSIEGHKCLAQNYSERCLTGIELNNYLRIPIEALEQIDCQCFSHWPKPLSCSTCSHKHSYLLLFMRLLGAKISNRPKLNKLCDSVLGQRFSQNIVFQPLPPKTLRTRLPKDLAIAICHFNPCEYKNPIKNLIETVRQFSPLPVFVLELVYGDKKPSLTLQMFGGHSTGVTLWRAKSNSIMFHKENLWMHLAKRIPCLYTKLVFLDGDIIVNNPTVWASRCSLALDTYKIIQPLSSIKFQEHGALSSTQPLLIASWYNRLGRLFDPFQSYPSPGYGLGVERKWLKNVGGLVESAVVGAGDLFSLCTLVDLEHVKNTLAWKMSSFAHKEIERYIKNCMAQKTTVGFVGHEGIHLYHGKRSDRQYANRHEIMKELREEHLTKNEQGIYEFSPEFSELMKHYFLSRNEDE